MRARIKCLTWFSVALCVVAIIPFCTSAMTPAQFQQYINEINRKAAARYAIPSRKVAVISYNGACPILPSNISYGMRGEDVVALQLFLIAQHELTNGSATGYFGALTQAALQNYQKSRAIVSSGTPTSTGYGAAGPKTRKTISQCGSGSVASVAQNTSSIQMPVAPAATAVQQNQQQQSSPAATTDTSVVATPSADTSSTDYSSASESMLPSSYISCGTLDKNKIAFDQGYGYVINNFVSGGDTAANLENSNLVLYENGFLIGPSHASLDDVRTAGSGNFSHLNNGTSNALYFSTTDNSNPITNTRAYTYGVDAGSCP
jgi:peptidoglycan hydrolase-like protein with peptidoglycan-binding domain